MTFPLANVIKPPSVALSAVPVEDSEGRTLIIECTAFLAVVAFFAELLRTAGALSFATPDTMHPQCCEMLPMMSYHVVSVAFNGVIVMRHKEIEPIYRSF
jgi:hypothetical protein